MPNATIKRELLGETKICSYGCGKVAKYEFSNGKFCCHSVFNKCDVVRQKNSLSTKDGYDTKKRTAVVFSEEKKKQIAHSVRETRRKIRETIPWSDLHIAIKKRLVREEQENACLSCGIREWMGKPIVLEVDHIDGDKKNNNRNNLRALCPNCHSLTETWRRRKSRVGSPIGRRQQF